MEKVILHIDGDAFFVGCEVAKNPKLKGKAVVTGEERGIVSALSYEAKALGVTRGMPIFRLRKEFPQILVLPGDYKSYVEYSEKMFNIVRRYTEEVEEYSIDECFADLTGWERPLKMSYEEIAKNIKREVNGELGLSVSIGIAPTKVLAKIASNFQKPNGLTIITINNSTKFLEKTPIEKIWGIGSRSAIFFRKNGIQTAQEFVDKSESWVKENLSKPYQIIWYELRGICLMKIKSLPKSVYHSIQKTRTFYPATSDKNFLLSQISKHIEDACRKARHYNLAPKKISFFLKTQNFKYKSFEAILPIAGNAPEPIISVVKKYFKKIHEPHVLYRTAGVTLHDLIPISLSQLDLFGENIETKKFEVIHKQIDTLEQKFGRNVVHLASTQMALTQKTKGTDNQRLDGDLLFL